MSYASVRAVMRAGGVACIICLLLLAGCDQSGRKDTEQPAGDGTDGIRQTDGTDPSGSGPSPDLYKEYVEAVRQAEQAEDKTERQEKYEKAADLGERLLDGGPRAAGFFNPENPDEDVMEDEALQAEYRLIMLGIADVFAFAGRLDRAVTLYERVLAVLRDTGGAGDQRIIELLQQLADLETRRGNIERALSLLEESLEIAKGIFRDYRGPDREEGAAQWSAGILGPALKLQQFLADHGLASTKFPEADLAQIIEGARKTAADDIQELGAPEFAPPPISDFKGIAQKVYVHYATHRNRTGSEGAYHFYGKHNRNKDGKPGLDYGITEVSVPYQVFDKKTGTYRPRIIGEIPSLPKEMVYTEYRLDDIKRHVIVHAVQPVCPDDSGEDCRALFLAKTREVMASTDREAFVFIHGFWNSFATAAERTAQLAADLELKGVPFMYTWPSDNRLGLFAYFRDQGEATEAVGEDLAGFLKDVALCTGAERVAVVAHSMGNEFLVKALEHMSQDTGPHNCSGEDAGNGEPATAQEPMFDEMVFSSADVNSERFRPVITSAGQLSRRMTLFASRVDLALRISRWVNARHSRAGDFREPVILPGVLETLDTTLAPKWENDRRKHDDFSRGAFDELAAVVWASLAPRHRCLLERDETPAPHWKYTGENCEQENFREALVRVRRSRGSRSRAREGLAEDDPVARLIDVIFEHGSMKAASEAAHR